MAASSAMLIVCLSFCDLLSICVMVCDRGLTAPAPSVLLPLTCEPFVLTKSLGFHFLLWGLVYSIYGCCLVCLYGCGCVFVGGATVYVGCV
jgi:hypothetical protein